MIINDKLPKHTRWNPSFPPSVSKEHLRNNYLKECWALRFFDVLPMHNRKQDAAYKAKMFLHLESPEPGYSEREWAQYCFTCTFGMYTNDPFVASKYLEYMAAFDARNVNATHHPRKLNTKKTEKV